LQYVPLWRGRRGRICTIELKKDTMSDNNNSHYNKKLQPFAKALRSEMTKAEACLWKYVLKARKMKGYQFRRQRPVLNYIADFMCKELNLIIEVDGVTHSYETVALKDEKRTLDLENHGFTVLRYSDEEVLHHIENVHEGIASWIDDHAVK
jgi:very-short-patch-repair endonuclease